ncbi:MAG TPA: hydrogenase formation protein HypD [Acidisarcina sp.]|nr:hydrogenase formation protein HypD [Acidisarcina sp.]
MKYIDEYRDEKVARALLANLQRIATRDWVLMEVCGGQTHTLMRYGIDELLPRNMQMVHGPGCPVCVTPLETIDKAVALAERPEVILVSYGDMLRVPGSATDLLHVKARGGDVRMAYSPLESLKIARENPTREVVFFGIGFETTAPPNAAAVWQAQRMGLKNFSLLASHVLVPPAVRTLMSSPKNRVQGLIAPGHVCAIVGTEDYKSLASEFHIPIVVGGFEPVDLLEAIVMLTAQLEEGRAEVEIQYTRSVTAPGNLRAQQIVADVFEVCDQKWRGLGPVPKSGLRMREGYRAFDAEARFDLHGISVDEPTECISAEILQGLKRPTDCPAFAGRCKPEAPLGAPMVSAEGACAAYYHYRRHESASLVSIGGN